MALGDILSVTIPDATTAGQSTDGWYCDVEVEGFVIGGSYDFGLGVNNDPTNSKFVMTVVSEGYDATGTLGTVTRTVYGTRVLRKRYPDESVMDETDSGGNVILRIALSDFVYDDDKNGGEGTSGTDPTVSIASDWYTDDGAGGTTAGSNAATDLAVTNNATIDYPVAIGQWGVVPAQRIQADFVLRATGRHRSGVSLVKMIATGANSGNVENHSITDESAIEHASSGLYSNAYKTTLEIDGFDQGEEIGVALRVYPVVGDADSVFDSDDFGAVDAIKGMSVLSLMCDKTGGLDEFAVVATDGNDGTGEKSTTLSTAAASPFATVGAAISSGASVIYARNGTYPILGTVPSSPPSLTYWQEVKPYPSEVPTLELDGSTKTYKTSKLAFRGLSIQHKAGTSNQWLDGEDGSRWLWFDDCSFDHNGQSAPVVSPSYRSHGAWHTDCEFTAADKFGYAKNFGARMCNWFQGCSVPSDTGGHLMNVYRLVGCNCDNIGWIEQESTTISGPEQDPIIIEFNRFHSYSAPQPQLTIAKEASVEHGVSLVGNVIEKTEPTTPALQISADGTTSITNHCLIWHNTIAGQRANLAYNDFGSSATQHTNWSQVGNVVQEWNNKDDTFTPPDANRDGSWSVGYNAGTHGCLHSGDSGSGAFRGEFDGITTDWGATPTFIDDQSGTGGGDGDYRLLSGSAGESLVSDRVIFFDLDGNPRDEITAAGAYRGADEGTGPPEFIAGVASVNDVGETTISVAATDATGGTPPYAYQWEQSLNGTDFADVVGATALALDDTGLASGTEYFYRLRYTDDDATVAVSNTVNATTDVPPVDLTPGVATVGQVTETTISVSATDASGGTPPYVYQWYKSTDGTNFNPVAGATTRTLNDSGLTSGATYHYLLEFADDDGTVEDSNTVSATTSEPAPPPSGGTGGNPIPKTPGTLPGSGGPWKMPDADGTTGEVLAIGTLDPRELEWTTGGGGGAYAPIWSEDFTGDTYDTDVIVEFFPTLTHDTINDRLTMTAAGSPVSGFHLNREALGVDPGKPYTVVIEWTKDTASSLVFRSAWADTDNAPVTSLQADGVPQHCVFYLSEEGTGDTYSPTVLSRNIADDDHVCHIDRIAIFEGAFEPVNSRFGFIGQGSDNRIIGGLDCKHIAFGHEVRIDSGTEDVDVGVIAIGNNAQAVGVTRKGIVIGNGASISDDDSFGGNITAAFRLAIGEGAIASAWRGMAVGPFAAAFHTSGMAIGTGSVSEITHGDVIGRGGYIPQEIPDVNVTQIANADFFLDNGTFHFCDPSYASVAASIDIAEENGVNPSGMLCAIHGKDAFDARETPADFNVGGSDLAIVAGRSTGTGTGGRVGMQTCDNVALGQNTKQGVLWSFYAEPNSQLSNTYLGYTDTNGDEKQIAVDSSGVLRSIAPGDPIPAPSGAGQTGVTVPQPAIEDAAIIGADDTLNAAKLNEILGALRAAGIIDL